MSDGSVVLLTVAEYITPKGSVIQSRGLTPDVKLEVHMLSRRRVAVYSCACAAVYSCACAQMRIDACRRDMSVDLAVRRCWFRRSLCGFGADKGSAHACALDFQTHEISHGWRARTHTHAHAHARTRSDALTVGHTQVMDLQGLVRNGKINGKPVTDALTDITAACQAGN